MGGGGIKKSLIQTLVELRAVVRHLYRLMPSAVVVMATLAVVVVVVTLCSQALVIFIMLMVVFFVSVLIYATTGNYGESSLALAAGLISVFSVEWSGARFLAFIVVWLGFSFLVMIIASVKIAARVETVFRQA